MVGGGSAAAFNLVLPAIVSSHLPPVEFAAWSLALQIVAYINLLSLGLQTATARAIAQAEGNDNPDTMQHIVRAANCIATWACLAASIAAAALAFCYPLLFPSIPQHLLGSFEFVVLMIGLSTASQLLAIVPMGVFQGLHRNIIYVSVQVVVRLLVVGSVWAGTRANMGLVGLAALLAAGSALLWPLMRYVMRTVLRWSVANRRMPVDRKQQRELLDYCASLSVWSIATLLVNSVGVVMVGHVAFEQAGVYSLAMSVATVLAGLLGALFSPLVTTAAALHANTERRNELPRLLMKATLYCAIVLNCLFTLCLLFVHSGIVAWVGPRYVEPLSPLLLILVGAHALRNLASPYAMMLLATGLHRRALATAAGEGLCNLVATVVLGSLFQTTGIAAGTLVGAVVAILSVLLLNARRTPELTPHPMRFALVSVVLPLAVFAPIDLFIAHWKAIL
ncbi:lipopolysaccharide biosynthesis protein [Burkholderiaceae bacterium UC74_6]